jgi:omega-amidase
LYQAWGHSTAVDPFGKVIAALDENPNIAYCEVDPAYSEEVRTMIPLRNQKRPDLYKL